MDIKYIRYAVDSFKGLVTCGVHAWLRHPAIMFKCEVSISKRYI